MAALPVGDPGRLTGVAVPADAWPPGPGVQARNSDSPGRRTLLSGDLYGPGGHPPGPVLVSYYPYRKDDIIGGLFERTRIRLASAATPACSWTWRAPGRRREVPAKLDLPREGRDGAEIIEWVAGQDWCEATSAPGESPTAG